MVEIDYQHETQSVLNGLPVYPHEAGSYPYYIAISDPTPSLDTGLTRVYAFHVDEPIPTVNIPLDGDEVLPLDLNGVYNTTFHSINSYHHRADYGQLPEHFDSYSLEDQERIRQRMRAVTMQQTAND